MKVIVLFDVITHRGGNSCKQWSRWIHFIAILIFTELEEQSRVKKNCLGEEMAMEM